MATPHLAAQVDAALSIVQRRVGDRLRAAYLHGSALTGGLRPHSDVDLLLALTDRIDVVARAALSADFLGVSGPPGSASRPLELTFIVIADVVPWRYPPHCELQLGEWLRAEITSGSIPQARPDPDLAILLTSLREHSMPLLGPAPADVFDPVPQQDVARAMSDLVPVVGEGWLGDERNALLTLARMWATAETLEILSKDAAAAWSLDRLPVTHRGVIERARAEYLTGERQDWDAVHDDVGAAVSYLRELVEGALARHLAGGP